MLSLDAPAGEGIESIGEILPDPSPPIDETCALRIDVGRFVASLPEPLVTACDILMADSISAGAIAAGVHRSTAHDWVARLRGWARDNGLSPYVENHNSYSAPVSGIAGGTTAADGHDFMSDTGVHYRRRLLLAEAEFLQWLAAASPGAKLEYHRGFLVLDAAVEAGRLARSERAELVRVAEAARSASARGLVHLVQRRHANCDYSYIAIARPSEPSATREARHG
jgi:hypothetical protein